MQSSKSYGIPGKVMVVYESYVQKSCGTVRGGGRLSNWFKYKFGVSQRSIEFHQVLKLNIKNVR